MTNSGEPGLAARGPRWEPAGWFLLCAAVYGVLCHGEFYKTDGPDIARLLDAHVQTGAPLEHPWHVGFLPVLETFRRLLLACGARPDYLQLGGWFSALGTAAGVGFAFAGMRRLAAPGVARLAALALALNPGYLLFATVVEYHGPLQAALGLAFWWTAVQVQRPTWAGMAALGLLGHAAFLLHGQALFHPAWLLPFFLARRWPCGSHRRDLAFAGFAGAVHAGLWLLLPRCWPGAYGMWADLGRGFATEASIGRPQSLDYTPAILWQEWLWPLLPVGMLVWLAPLRRALRAEFLAFACGLLPFLYVSVRQLVFEPEYGAYLLPMVLPACLLVAQAAEGRARAWFAGSLLLGLLPVLFAHRPHFEAQRRFDADFARGVAAAANGARPFVLVGSHRELAAAYATLGVPATLRPPLDGEVFLWVRSTATMPIEQATPAHFAGVEGYLKALHAAGRAVLCTAAALSSLDDPRAAMLAEKATLQVPANETLAGPRFAAHLRARFQIAPVAPGLLRLSPKN